MYVFLFKMRLTFISHASEASKSFKLCLVKKSCNDYVGIVAFIELILNRSYFFLLLASKLNLVITERQFYTKNCKQRENSKQ